MDDRTSERIARNNATFREANEGIAAVAGALDLGTVVGERARRIGQNEALFRSVNERIRDVNDAFGSVTGDFEIVCECGNVDCAERITLTAEEYADVRADPRYFAVLRGHVAQDVEGVIERFDRYDLVQKAPGAPERIARVTEPARSEN